GHARPAESDQTRMRSSLHYLAEEALDQHAPGLRLAYPASPEVVHPIRIQSACGGAMAAFHVIGIDFQHRLGIDFGGFGEEDGAVELVPVGALGVGLDRGPALKHATGLPVQGTLVDFAAAAMRRLMHDVGGVVDM